MYVRVKRTTNALAYIEFRFLSQSLELFIPAKSGRPKAALVGSRRTEHWPWASRPPLPRQIVAPWFSRLMASSDPFTRPLPAVGHCTRFPEAFSSPSSAHNPHARYFLSPPSAGLIPGFVIPDPRLMLRFFMHNGVIFVDLGRFWERFWNHFPEDCA